MIRSIALLLSLFLASEVYSQNLTYGVGFGTPLNRTIGHQFSNGRIEKENTISFSIGFKGINTVYDNLEVKFSTYKANTYFSSFTFPGVSSATRVDSRKYFIELQSMNYRLSLNKFGNIDLGGKFSYMMRSHISVISFNPDSSLGSEVSSQDYDQGRRFFISAVARYSIVTFKINDSYSITPTYTFNYSILNSSRNTLASDSLTGHLFEVILTRKLSKINRHKYLHNRHLHM